MSRIKGTYTIGSNYEVSIPRPFDARMMVNTKADLTDSTSWTALATYNGMLVSVSADPDSNNNGVYILKNRLNLTSEDSWEKVAKLVDISNAIAEVKDYTDQEVDKLNDRLALVASTASTDATEKADQALTEAKSYTDLQIEATKSEIEQSIVIRSINEEQLQVTEGQLNIKSISTDLIQQGMSELILTGGSATTLID